MPAHNDDTASLELLLQGEMEIRGEFLWGSNYTFLTQITQAEQTVQAVYKPTRGERPLWDFPPASLARREVPNLILLITGEGPAKRALHRQAEALGLSEAVRFIGYLDRRHELPDCYAAADGFVFASRTETQGLVLLEAMAMGLPVVALAAMGTCDILSPGRGCLTPEDDVAAFAAAMVRLLCDPALRSRLSQEARDYAREWADDRLAAKLAECYRRILETADRPNPGACPASSCR